MGQLKNIVDAVKIIVELKGEIAKLKAEIEYKEQIIRKQTKAIQELAVYEDKETANTSSD